MKGNKIKHYRLKAGLTQTQLAKKVGAIVGKPITYMAISNYEHEKRSRVNEKTKRAIVEALNAEGVNCCYNDLYQKKECENE